MSHKYKIYEKEKASSTFYFYDVINEGPLNPPVKNVFPSKNDRLKVNELKAQLLNLITM